MPTIVTVPSRGDLTTLSGIEDAADRLFVERYVPRAERADWHGAPSGSQRAAAPGFLLVAREAPDAPVVGFVHVLEPAGLAHLEQLSVLPQHGRRGHGRALVRAALQEAAARGHRQVTLRTYRDVPFNAPFYRSCGFVESEPATRFHRRLVEAEAEQGLGRYGHRVQMTALLPAKGHSEMPPQAPRRRSAR